MDCSTPGSSVLHYLLEFAHIHVHWAGDAIWPSHLLLPSSHFALDLSQHQDLFQRVSLCIRGPKDWSLSFSVSPSNEYSGLISFRNNWFDLLDIQATVKSLLQHPSSKTSVLWCSAFFMVPLLSWCAVTQLKVKIQVLSQAFFRMDYIGWWTLRL